MPVTSKETRRKVDESLIPQNVEAEEAVLGAILVNPETLAKVSDTLYFSHISLVISVISASV